ncbi:MAG: AraC family ligand binding domain-containing protein [Chloroflexi bacterium]|nr:AraC family ligand binding domain-containing protein [Chloroflexota bacterium]MBL7164727.1 AraC family ligand binding domain-containing protein [Anaerolineales bacterium]
MSDRVEMRFRAIIDAVRVQIRTKVACGGEVVNMLTQIEIALGCINDVVRNPLPKRLSACRHLPEVFSLAKNTNMAPIASAFEKIEPYLKWVQNPNYSDDRLGPGYMENYAYCDFIGPRGLAGGNEIAAGFLLLGPNRLYPDHCHTASEIYCVIAGTADWRTDGGNWRAEPPGKIIFHSPWTVHATRSRQQPLLALYFWLGDVTQAADLS